MTRPDPAKAHAFLTEYAELCSRHGLLINACGCCNSPFIDKVKRPAGEPAPWYQRTLSDHLAHLRGELK